ncbi:hypothetical protein BD779DRAFT_1478346 [Infundibulicybe gibba]|nr:hypothetical protein BD779DRAFT_1478346 [Infundibulicybe gibba]
MARSAPFQPELACRCADARKFPSPGREGQGGGGQHRARLEDEPHKIWRPSPYGPTAHFGTISPDSSDVAILQSGCRGRLSSRGWWGRRRRVIECAPRALGHGGGDEVLAPWWGCWSLAMRCDAGTIELLSRACERHALQALEWTAHGWGSAVVSLEAREDNGGRLGALGCPQSGDRGRMGFLERALGAMRGVWEWEREREGNVCEKERGQESEPESEEEKNSLPRLHRQELPQETCDSTTRDEHGGDEMGGVDPHRRVASPQAPAQSGT